MFLLKITSVNNISVISSLKIYIFVDYMVVKSSYFRAKYASIVKS